MPHTSALEVLVLHGLRLKGFAEASDVARLADRSEADVARQLADAAQQDLVVRREGRLSGWTLTPSGRAAGQRLLGEELDAVGARDELDEAYERFLALNGEMLATCTRWQVRRFDGQQVLNDHSDPAYDRGVVEELVAIDAEVQPICAGLAVRLARFAHYAPRFRAALERVRAGEHQWFTKPVIESYHTVWFELHEDLLASLGLDRASEASRR